METSLFLAKIIGITYLVVGIGILLNLGYYRKMLSDVVQDTGVMYLSGFLTTILGLLLLLTHNQWASDWTVIITIVAWLGLIKGVSLILFPKALSALSLKMVNNTGFLTGAALVALLMGGVLTYFGFSA